MSSSKSFFKVILCTTLHDHKLSIPDKFVKNYGDELSDFVRLMVPTGGIWYVKVERTDKTIWLREGLRKFFEDHFIGFGYFLIFKYKGNSTFKIHICNLTASEIDYPKSSNSASPDDVNQLPVSDQEEDNDGHHGKSGDEDDDDRSIEFLGSSADHQLMGKLVQSSDFASGNSRCSVASTERWKTKRYYLTRNKKQKIQDDGGVEAMDVQDSIPPRRNKFNQSNGSTQKVTTNNAMLVSSSKANRKVTSSTHGKNSSMKYKPVGSKISPEVYLGKRPVEVQVNQALRAANMSLPKHPFYRITMKPYNICKNLVYLPSELARLYLPRTTQLIKLQDADDNEWEVHWTMRGGTACYLTKGWATFVKATNLMVGDVCVFEPIRTNEEVKLKVKISRAH